MDGRGDVERWLPVVGFEGRYEVSDQGRVRSVDRVLEIPNRWGGTTPRCFRGRVLSPQQNGRGYRTVHLRTPGQTTMPLVSWLVAAAFIGPRPAGQQVCHCNGDSQDDRLVNLRYDTPQGNAADCLLHGTRRYGERHPGARLTTADVCRIREAASRGVAQYDIAAAFGVRPQQVSRIVTGKGWARV